MASEQEVGNIIYTVQMDVAGLIAAQQKVNDRLDKMDGQFEKTGKAADSTSKSFASLTKVATALTAALSVREIAAYADAWTTVNNKLANSVRVGEQLTSVTQRVFDISQNTRASLDATASLYARLERATRSYGTSAEDLTRLTTIINQGFVVSGATAEEASNAVIQLSQGLAAGALRGEEFNSVTEQGSRLANALADSLGVDIGQLRAMAAQGQLTTDVVVNGLLSQGDAIGREFSNTISTIGQSLTIAGNNLTQFIGSSTTVRASVAIFNDTVVTLSENLDAVSTVVIAVAAVIGSRYVSALTMAAASQLKVAATAFTASTSLSAFGAATGVARSALALVGGPVGAATLAASAIFYFYQKAQEAKKAAIELADGVNKLIGEMKDMSATELSATIAKLRSAIPELNSVLADAQAEYDKTSARVANLTKEVDNWGLGTKRGRQANEALTGAIDAQSTAAAALEKAQRNLSQTQNAVGIAQANLNGNMAQGIDLLKRNGEEAGVAAGMMNQLGKAIGFAAGQKEKFNATSLTVQRDPKQQQVLDDLYSQNELLSETNLRKREQLKVEQQLRKLGADDETIRIARENAGANFDLAESQKEVAKETKASAKEQTAAERAEESRAKKLQDLSNEMAVAALKSKGLNREAAQLAAVQELGAGATQAQIQQAQQQAGQIFDIQQQAADKKAAIDADSAAKAKQQRDLDNAQLDRQLKAGDVTFEQSQQRRAQIAADYSKAIADASSQAVVTPQQQLAGQVDPVQQLANENAQKLALIKEYTAQRVITEEQGLALMNAANTEYEAQRTAAQWQLLSQQGLGYDMLTSAVDAFAGNASNAITGLLTGTMSVSDAMRSLGSTILNSVINSLVQVGVEALKNFIVGQTMGTAATAASVGQASVVASAWAPAAAMTSLATLGANSVPAAAAITSTVGLSSGLALAGMRKNGGPVSAGSMYRVGEGGEPELLQSGGKNYMIPGDGGKVISNADLQTGGGGNIQVSVVFNDYTSGSHSFDAQTSQDGNNLTIQAFVMDMDNKGPMHSAITRNTTATSRATGG
ncbi:tape measure protein [Hafnia paralvei]|uniref:tape measure protein n=1 Tax=Hafnia paralvei TaxID=546367 RepID=UPI001FFEFC40|nr:tape measure protein [Hafnia paralvei]MCK2179399.1 tape measure protein [Hafnia paralvei]